MGKSNFKGIIPFSGGIDSTASLYLTLTQDPGEQYLVFRVDLWNGTSGSRTIREAQSTDSILEKLRESGITNFSFRKLSFDYSSLGPPPVWDSEVINFMAAVAIQAHPEISHFIDGAIWDDYQQEGFTDRLNKIADILYATTGKTTNELQIVFPIKDLKKYEVMTTIPKELLALTWSCRYPKIGAPYTYVRCHDCPQCSILDGVLAEHPTEFSELENLK